MCKMFAEHNLRITIDINHKIVNVLDVNFNLETELFKPFMKPNNDLLYVHRKSNHPPSVTKNIPAGVNKRLSSISANEGVFKNAIPPDQNALRNSGYEVELKFDAEASKTRKAKNRSRNITWINPPFSANVATPVGEKILKIIDTCFPKSHPLHKICNRNTIKVSYRCMPNMGKVLSMHNAKIAK